MEKQPQQQSMPNLAMVRKEVVVGIPVVGAVENTTAFSILYFLNLLS
jgi:hypothetical protein